MNQAPPRAALVALAGIVSGTLYALWVGYGTEALGRLGRSGGVLDDLTHHAGAGIFYAVFVGGVLHAAWKFEAWRWALWIVGAGISYAVAFNLAIQLYEPKVDWAIVNFLCGGAAGVVGAALLGGFSAVLFRPLRHGRMVLAGAVFGGIVGLALPLALQSDAVWGWIAFFALWQGAYAVASTRLA